MASTKKKKKKKTPMSKPAVKGKPASKTKAVTKTRPSPKKKPAPKQKPAPTKKPAARKKGAAEARLAYAFLSERDYTDAVRLVAEGMFGGPALVSDADALGFDTPDGGVFVEAQLDPRVVRVAAHLGATSSATRDDPDLVARLTSQVTARLMLGRVIETDRAIFFVVDVPAEPFVPLHAAQAIVTARAAAPEIRAQLAQILED